MHFFVIFSVPFSNISRPHSGSPFISGVGVSVGGTGVFVGGTGVAVGSGVGVSVGGTGVFVEGTGVVVGSGSAVEQPANNNNTASINIIRFFNCFVEVSYITVT